MEFLFFLIALSMGFLVYSIIYFIERAFKLIGNENEEIEDRDMFWFLTLLLIGVIQLISIWQGLYSSNIYIISAIISTLCSIYFHISYLFSAEAKHRIFLIKIDKIRNRIKVLEPKKGKTDMAVKILKEMVDSLTEQANAILIEDTLNMSKKIKKKNKKIDIQRQIDEIEALGLLRKNRY